MSFLDKIKGAFSKEKKDETSPRLPHFNNNSHYSGNAIIYTPGLETNNAKKADAKPDFVPIVEQKQEIVEEPVAEAAEAVEEAAISFEEPVAEVAEAIEEPAISFEEPVAEVAEAIEEPAISFEEPVAEVAEVVEEPAISFEEPVSEVAEAIEEPAISFEEPAKEVEEAAESFIYTPETTESEAESFIYTPEETDLSFESGADFGTVNDDDIPSFEIVSDDAPAISFDESVDLDFSAPTDDE